MKIQFQRAHLAILFAILFITIGWIAPAAYASYAPQSEYIEVHEFSAQDATISDDQHQVCFNRTVHNPSTATVFTELYLVQEGGERIEVDSRTLERYLQAGDTTVKTAFPLPDNIQPGEYRYVMVVNMDLTQGRVERSFEFTSESFTISTSSENISTTACY